MKTEETGDLLACWIHVIDDADLSERVQRDLDVDHASPQVVFLLNGEAVWHASEYNVTEYDLDEGFQHVHPH